MGIPVRLLMNLPESATLIGLCCRLDKEFSVVAEAEEKNRGGEEDDADGSEEEEESADEEMEQVPDAGTSHYPPSLLPLSSPLFPTFSKRKRRKHH